jgi:hypothetical protein
MTAVKLEDARCLIGAAERTGNLQKELAQALIPTDRYAQYPKVC